MCFPNHTTNYCKYRQENTGWESSDTVGNDLLQGMLYWRLWCLDGQMASVSSLICTCLETLSIEDQGLGEFISWDLYTGFAITAPETECRILVCTDWLQQKTTVLFWFCVYLVSTASFTPNFLRNYWLKLWGMTKMFSLWVIMEVH